ncbi:uncharacterized protein LOC105913745 [Setaria italica]|uniref:uncharacterized protein LOC105913745 n=1 Tax=Setaria italica TaxID=4555 RepID=UPI0006487A77|nr:uncharacterized protein LOC105913745 [Setaria italica]
MLGNSWGRGRVSQGGGRGRGRVAEVGSDDVAGLGGEPISQDVAASAAQHTGVKKTSKRKASDTGDSIEWTDANTMIICSLFAKQVKKGNRPNTHLNSVGYDEVSNEFFNLTTIRLIKRQMKNKRDKLKTDLTTWKKLMRKQTGAGWDRARGVIDMDDEWWKKTKVDIPGCGKFRKKSLQNEENLTESESDSDDSNDESEVFWNLMLGAVEIAQIYADLYLVKNPPRTSGVSGTGWLLETMKSPGECHRQLRMNNEIFLDLHGMFVGRYGLRPSMHISTYEMLAMFLYTCAGNESNRRAQNRFKHSGETISRKFDEVLNALMAMEKDYIRPKNPNFPTVHKRIRDDKRAYPHFKDCIGALDGTHIRVALSPDEQVRYIGKTGVATKNVLAVCDFDMRFTYVSTGQPGAMHDTSVLYNALRVDQEFFPHPPQGKYYVVDAGYPNRPGYLTPYKGERREICCGLFLFSQDLFMRVKKMGKKSEKTLGEAAATSKLRSRSKKDKEPELPASKCGPTNQTAPSPPGITWQHSVMKEPAVQALVDAKLLQPRVQLIEACIRECIVV